MKQCRGCWGRLEKLLPAWGFVFTPTPGAWKYTTRRGEVLLDMKPTHPTRMALLALFTRLVA